MESTDEMARGAGEPSAKRAKADEADEEEQALVRRREELILGVENMRAKGKELEERLSRFNKLKDRLFLRIPSFILDIVGAPSWSQGCASTCTRLILAAWSLARHLVIRSLAMLERPNSSHQTSLPSRISVSVSKGMSPQSMS